LVLLPRLALNCDPPDLCLPSSWDYRFEPPVLSWFRLFKSLKTKPGYWSSPGPTAPALGFILWGPSSFLSYFHGATFSVMAKNGQERGAVLTQASGVPDM
jgi:hypothetical protein